MREILKLTWVCDDGEPSCIERQKPYPEWCRACKRQVLALERETRPGLTQRAHHHG